MSVHKFFDDPMLLELAKQAGPPVSLAGQPGVPGDTPKLWHLMATSREHDDKPTASPWQDAELSSYF